MTFEYPGPGSQDYSSYFASGLPWVTGSQITGSIVHYSFPAVTKRFVIKNTTASSTVAVGFTQNGMGSIQRNFFTVVGVGEEIVEMRIKDLFLSATQGAPVVEVLASLTTILYDQFPVLTGSISGSVTLNKLFSGIG